MGISFPDGSTLTASELSFTNGTLGQTLNFLDGETTANIRVADNAVTDSTESFKISEGSSAYWDSPWIPVLDSTHSDCQPADGVTVDPTTLAVAELGVPSTIEKTYTVKLNTDPTADVTITVANGDSTAVEVDTDGSTTGNQNTLTFTHGSGGNWSTEQTVTVRALNDADVDAETVALSHTAAVSDTNNAYHEIDISDVSVTTTDAGHGIVVSASSLSVVENLTAGYTVALKSDPGGTVVVTPSSGATATASVSGVLTFTSSNWSMAQTVTVTGGTPGSTNISHAVTTGTTDYPTSTTMPSLSVTVTADTRPVVTITGGSAVTEGTAASFTVTVTPAPSADLTVNLDVSESDNFVAAADEGTRSVTVGTSGTATVTVNTTVDSTDELNGSVKVAVETGTGYRVSNPGTATVEVIDNDPTAVTLAGGGTVAEDGNDSADVTVTLGRALVAGESVTVPLSVSGTGVTASDYAIGLKSGSSLNSGVVLDTSSPHSAAAPAVVFTGHGTNTVSIATLTISAQQDRDDEGASESLTVGFGSGNRAVMSNLDRASGTGTAGTTPTGTAGITITDDDTAGVTVTPTSRTVAEAGGTATYTVVLDSRPSGSVTITAASGNAAVELEGPDAGSTYSASERLVFTTVNWNAAQTVTVRGVDDNVVNTPARSATVSHSIQSGHGDGGGYTPSAPTIQGVTVALTDDEEATPELSLSVASRGNEGASGQRDVDLTVSLSVARTGATAFKLCAAPDEGSTSAAVLRTAHGHEAADYDLVDSGGTALALDGDDCASLSLAAGATSLTVKIRVFGDSSAERPEDVVLELRDAPAGVEIAEPDSGGTAYYQIGNDDGNPVQVETVTAGAAVAEGSPARFPLTVSGAAAAALHYTVSDDGTSDFVASGEEGAQTLALVSGTTSYTIEVPTVNDTTDEADGAVSVTLSRGDGYIFAGDASTRSATVSVTDDDLPGGTPVVSFASGTASAGESTGTHTVTVNLSPAPQTGITLAYTLSGSATRGTDYTISGVNSNSATVAVAAGVTSATIAIAIVITDDADDESNETVILTLGTGSGYTVGSQTIHTLTITDDDTAGVTVSPTSRTVAEAGGTATYTVVLDSRPSGSVTITAASGNAAVELEGPDAGSTYSASEALVFTTANWNAAQTVTVRGVDDSIVNTPARSATVSHSIQNGHGDGGDYTPSAPTIPGVTVTLTDDDTTGTQQALVSNLGQSGGAWTTLAGSDNRAQAFTTGSNTGGYTLASVEVAYWSPSAANQNRLTVTLRRANNSGNPGATLGTLGNPTIPNVTNRHVLEHAAPGSGIQLEAGTTYFVHFSGGLSGSMGVTAMSSDAEDAGAASGWSIADGSKFGGSNWGDFGNSIQIRVNGTVDQASGPVVSIAGSGTVTESGDAVFNLSADPAPSSTITVNVTVADSGAFASGGQTGARTVEMSSGSASLTVATAGDSTDEPNGTITATVATGSGYSPSGTNGSATIAVADDDATTVTLSTPDASAEEGSTSDTATVRLALNRGLVNGETLTVPLRFTGGTIGTHFTLACPSPRPSGVSCVNLGAANAAVTFTGPNSGTTATTANLTLSVPGNAVTADRTVTVDIPRSSSTGSPRLTAGGLGGGATGVRTGNGQIELTDDATNRPTVTIESGSAVTEGMAAGFTLRVSPVPSAALSVRVRVADAPGSNFLTSANEGVRTVTVAASQASASFSVPTATDSTDEANGPVSATVAAHTSYTVGSSSRATVAVADDDATTATLAGPAGSIREGGSKALTLTLNRGLRAGERLTVPLTFAGAATRGTDYGLSGTPATGVSYNNLGSGSATVVFTGPSTGASARTARLTLSATSDGTVESPETVNIGLGSPTFSGLGGGATGADNLANFNIEDPPPVVPTVRFSPATSRVTEDAGPQSIALHLNPAPSTPVTLRYAVGGTATAGSDYASLSGTIPVSPGDTTATLAVSITDDGDAEPAETVILTLTADAAYTVGTPGAHTLTIDSSDNPPTASDGTVRTRPSRAYAFRVGDFGYQDPDGDPLAHVTVGTLPSPGTLTLGGTNVAVDAQIARARIAAGDLKFTPAEQPLKGRPYARFTFKVNDGSADSVSSYTLAIDVANQPPVATDGEARLSSDTPHAFGLEDFRDLYSDADGDALAGIMIVAPPEKGMLALEDTAVTPNTAVSREKLEAGALVFMPEAGEGGSPYTSFGFQVYDGFEYSADPAQMVLHVESLAATRMMRQWLARFGRTVADQVIGAVEDRLRHPPVPARDASMQLSLAGRSLDSLQPLDEQALNAHSNLAASDPTAGLPAHSGVREGTDLRTAPLMSGEDVPLSRSETAAPDPLGRLDWIGGSSFHYARGNLDGGLKSVWGRGAVSQFDGRDGSARVDGRVESWMLGADFMQDGRALGILLSHSRGKGDYRTESGGRFESDLTGIYPYARHEIHERLSLWGVAGYGEGDVELHRTTETLETDVDLWMAAGGLRGQLRAGRRDLAGTVGGGGCAVA